MSKLKAVPEFNYMFVTCNRKEKTESGFIIPSGAHAMAIPDEQVILKVGETVRSLKPGMTVKIDPRPYFVKDWKNQNSPTIDEEVHKQTVGVAWPIEEIDGMEVMVVPDNHIRYHWPIEKKSGLEI